MGKTEQKPEDYIVPLNMNGLQGRMLHMRAPKGRNREILLIYGHHSSLERWFGLAQVINRYGDVTMPDLPGFGGMDSFYKIGERPTLDTLADYLASFIKLRYKRRRITIIGMSFGFVVATRMLQRFPDLAKKVDLLVSLVGFAHHDDFIFNKPRYWSYRSMAMLFGRPVPAKFFKEVILHPYILRTFYGRTHNAKNKMKDLSPEQVKQMLEVEVELWRSNEVRTYMATSHAMLTLDNCKARVDLPVWHIGMTNDHFFNNHNVEQHMRVIFNDFHKMEINLSKHAPTVIATAKEAAPYIPQKLRQLLSRS
ncbi:MAG TPA: alpha/beta hydrolase [Candidatus Saccharimonadales bacterium]|nr:alpha/beta hydrolase [Candidatus Saccharimonadales bacterium]